MVVVRDQRRWWKNGVERVDGKEKLRWKILMIGKDRCIVQEFLMSEDYMSDEDLCEEEEDVFRVELRDYQQRKMIVQIPG